MRDHPDEFQQPPLVALMLVLGMAMATVLGCVFAIGTLVAVAATISSGRGSLGLVSIPGGLLLASVGAVHTLSQAWRGRRWAIVGAGALAGVFGASLVAILIAVNAELYGRGSLKPVLAGVLGLMAVGVVIVTGCFILALEKWDRVSRTLARRRRGQAVCVACGYDLRGNPGAAACPECGLGRDTAPEARGRGIDGP